MKLAGLGQAAWESEWVEAVGLSGLRKFIAQNRKHFRAVTSSEFAVARWREMQMVRPAGTAIRGNKVRGGNSPGQLLDDFVHARARAFLIGGHEAAGEQRHILGFKVQVFEQAGRSYARTFR